MSWFCKHREEPVEEWHPDPHGAEERYSTASGRGDLNTSGPSLPHAEGEDPGEQQPIIRPGPGYGGGFETNRRRH